MAEKKATTRSHGASKDCPPVTKQCSETSHKLGILNLKRTGTARVVRVEKVEKEKLGEKQGCVVKKRKVHARVFGRVSPSGF